MTPRPVLLVYGNCQAETVGLILRDLPSICKIYDIHIAHNRLDPTTGQPHPPPDSVTRACAHFIYHVKPFGFLPRYAEELIQGGRGIRLPLVSCEVFWPSEVPSKHDPRNPQLPNGRYPRGDYILARLLRDNPDDEAVVKQYLEMDFAEVFPLDNAIKKWHRILEKLQNEAPIKVLDFISQNWQTQRLFWTSIHPANRLVGQIVRRLLELLGTPAGEPELESALRSNEEDFIMKPIHPSVVRNFRLTWVSDDDLYKHLNDPLATSREYYLRYVAYTRELMQVLPEPFAVETGSTRVWNNPQDAF